MNPLMMLTGNSNGSNMLMQAFGAMMRGESPQDFLKKVANSNPQLQGLNLDDLEGTAKTLCERNNVNMEELAAKIKDFAKST